MTSGAGIILVRDGKVLLLQGVSGIWSFPKGHGEDEDPNPFVTAVRETYEETGYMLGVDYEIIGDRMRLEKRIYWTARPLRTLREPSLIAREHKGYKWVPVGDVNWLNINGGVKAWTRRVTA